MSNEIQFNNDINYVWVYDTRINNELAFTTVRLKRRRKTISVMMNDWMTVLMLRRSQLHSRQEETALSSSDHMDEDRPK